MGVSSALQLSTSAFIPLRIIPKNIKGPALRCVSHLNDCFAILSLCDRFQRNTCFLWLDMVKCTTVFDSYSVYTLYYLLWEIFNPIVSVRRPMSRKHILTKHLSDTPSNSIEICIAALYLFWISSFNSTFLSNYYAAFCWRPNGWLVFDKEVVTPIFYYFWWHHLYVGCQSIHPAHVLAIAAEKGVIPREL